jgi:transcriptional regulator with XRE-family HTH domain
MNHSPNWNPGFVALLARHGYTPKRLADNAGMDHSTIWKQLCSGERPITVGVVRRVAHALNIAPAEVANAIGWDPLNP